MAPSPPAGRAGSRLTPHDRNAWPTPGELPQEITRRGGVLAVDKPAGWLTHADGAGGRPDVVGHLGGGVGVHQRLDIDTSGVLLFSTGPAGARRLQRAFSEEGVAVRFLAVLEGAPPAASGLLGGGATRYRVIGQGAGWTTVETWPMPGQPQRLRAHFAAAGCPIRGDGRNGDPHDLRAPRALLHCHVVDLGDGLEFTAPPPPVFARYMDVGPMATRAGLRADAETSCYRAINGAADGHRGWVVDRYDRWAVIQRAAGAPAGPAPAVDGIYQIDAQVDRSQGGQPGPVLLRGRPAPAEVEVLEHGTRYRVRLGEQLSTGLFLDQRPQRAWLARHAGGMRVLNTFAHAGGFSVAAACAGARTVSLDLSKAWLERIPGQLAANGVDPAGHDSIYGDVFDWLPRLARRGELFDLVILDPPSTSVGKKKRRWSAAQDYDALVALAAPLVAPGGALWTLTNHRGILPRRFAATVHGALPEGARLERVCPQPLDFPHDGPAAVKTMIWRLPG